MDLLAPVTDALPVGRGLYNGNISSMLVNIPQLGDAHLYGYSYDQLNRLTAMNAYTGLNTGNNSFVPSGTTHYRERVSYDGNGNILSYLRNGEGANTSMDNLGYAYNLSGGWLQNNKLRHVTDAVTTTPTGYGDLKNGQANDNYGYDAIGNLIKDESEGIASGGIEWNVYGKISQITKTNSGVTTVIKYTYDATGNRIGKWVQIGAGTPKQTAYVRDASGNVMAIYEKGNSEVNGGLLSQIEVPLYGSSRLGVWRPDREVETTGWEFFDTDPMTGTGGGIAGGWERGRVQFELSNHLGNVLVTISDARTAVDDGTYEVFTICHTCLPGIPCVPCFNEYDKQNSTPDGVVDYYLPQILTANDYYPFGMIMPGRKYSEGEYRYGFNGKEKDNDVKGEGNSVDFGARVYDPRVSRWFSVDDKERGYATPYNYSSNDPVNRLDPDGNDDIHFYFRTIQVNRTITDPKNPTICSTFVSYKTTASVVIIKTNGPDRFYHHKQFSKATINGFLGDPGSGTLVSDKVTNLQPFNGGRNGVTRSPLGGWPLNNIFSIADYDNTTLQKYMFSSPQLVDYIKNRGLTGIEDNDNGWEKALKYYKINGYLDKAIEITGFIADVTTAIAPIAGEARLMMRSGFGDLTIGEVNQIQKVVNEAGRPLEVAGSAAQGTRRGVGSNFPIGKGSGTKSDIDYLVSPVSTEYYRGLEYKLPGLDPKTGIIPGTANPHIGPSIKFEPGALKPIFQPGINSGG